MEDCRQTSISQGSLLLTPEKGKAVAGLRGPPVQQAADGQETT